MANIHEQIKKGSLEVMHQGYAATFSMPEWMKQLGDSGVLQDSEIIIKVLKDNDLLLGFLHAGLKECLVGLRAHIRPKDGEAIDGDKAGDPLTYKPKAQDIPGTKKKEITPEQAIETLKAGLTKEALKAKMMAMLAEMD
jgi:hypothetical protein